ncbi:MAG: hypothetical protein NVS4B8_20600 [Herpetosiphon sp.]
MLLTQPEHDFHGKVEATLAATGTLQMVQDMGQTRRCKGDLAGRALRCCSVGYGKSAEAGLEGWPDRRCLPALYRHALALRRRFSYTDAVGGAKCVSPGTPQTC